ncbi:MAG: CPBP family intramembrane metalloprotease, partial [Clostridium sp.]|nr:CPBP family intramembrane metalloprotease [Clostridium sp.]
KMSGNVRRVFSRVGLATAIMGIVVNAVQMLIITIFNKVNPSFESNGWFKYLLIAVSFYLIGFPLCCLILKGIPDGQKRKESNLTFWGFIKFFLISYFVMVLLNLFTMGFLWIIGIIKGTDVVNPLENVLSGSSIWATIIFAGILSPIIEEILFRGVMLNKLKTYGDKIAIITTALLFGLFHENFSQFFYAVGLGIIFAYVTLKTGTIKYSIGLHIVINMMGSVIGTQVIGNSTATMIFGIIIWIFVIAGLILFIKNFNKRSLLPGEVTIEKGHVLSETCLNVGMILNFIISISLMIYVLLI